MKNLHRPLALAALIGVAVIAAGTARAADQDDNVYLQTNLVSNLQNLVQPKDPDLQNAWGVANMPGGPLWVADNNDGRSTLYDGNGVKQGLKVTIPLPPGRTAPPAAAPTGMVWNPTSSFPITVGSTTVPATFIWASEDGTITAWNPMVDPIVAGLSTASLVVNNSAAGAVYKGLALGTNTQGVFLFATNFSAGTIDVFDKNFKQVPLALGGAFADPTIPAGFAPFGIANIDNNLYVTYAKQNAQKNDEIAGAGLGFVNVFTTNGALIKRFASGGTLNAPWGVARATQRFGAFSGAILIGNFGSTGKFAGWINAFDGGNDNDFLGELRNANHKPISIDGLWSLVFGTFLNSDADTLYFTAGPNQQKNGLFGKIVAQLDTEE